MSRLALIVTDLEGVHGADSVDCLIVGEPGWQRARLRATHEVNLVIAGLSRQGFDAFLVSDSHRNGSDEPNLVLEALDARARYDFRHDAFAAALFFRVEAVAALGMHAGGGVPGFVSHALDVGLAWQLGDHFLSETDFLLDLCAAAQVPFIFASGDDALVASLPEGVRGVVTKHVTSPVRASSLPLEAVEQALVQASLGPPRGVAPLPEGPLRLHVKGSQFDLPDFTFLERASAHTVRVAGGSSPRARYSNAMMAIDAVQSVTSQFITRAPGDEGFVREVEAFLSAPWPTLAR